MFVFAWKQILHRVNKYYKILEIFSFQHEVALNVLYAFFKIDKLKICEIVLGKYRKLLEYPQSP